MKLLKFDKFVNEKYNTQNESLKGFFSDLFKRVTDWFTGPGSWMKNLMKLKKEVGNNSYKELGIDFFDYSNTIFEKANESAETKNRRSGISLAHPSAEVPNVSFKEMEDILELHWASKNISPFIWGAPGIGKTDVVKQLAKKVGVPLILINLSMRDPVDFIGLPSIETQKDGKSGRTVYNLPKFFPDDNGKGGKGGIIFFDELNRASGPVLSASLQLLLDKQIDEYVLPSEWLIIAAGNRSVEAPEVTDLGPALANRVRHYNLIPDVESWTDWALSKKDKNDLPSISNEFIAFLLSNKEYFHSYTGDANSPWPSPRSWASAATNYSKLKETNPRRANDADFVKRILAADVGMDAASSFINFLKLSSQFTDKDVESVYKNPDKAKLPNIKDASVVYAILCKIVYAKVDTGVTNEEYINLIKYSMRFEELEYASVIVRMSKQQFPQALKDKKVLEVLEEWAGRFKKQLSVK